MTRVSELESLKKWFAYNARARKNYLETMSKLSPEELTRNRGASYPTILDIFKHSFDGLSTWINKMSVLHDTFISPYSCPEPPSLSDLYRYNEEAEKEIDDFFSHLTEEDMDRTYLVKKLPPWWDEDFNAPVRDTLYHLVEHELQHRGELNALLWQIDVEPPILDWLFDGLS
ncbi:MAG TPA: DinB family protein [Nitrososphaerales archaeon]|nr:DinB family protein [Nitrososphaerales archaeon]